MTQSVEMIRVGRRGQIVLPREVRYALGVAEGDRLAFLVQDGEVTLRPMKATLLDLRGSVPSKGQQDFDTVRAKTKETHAKKVARGGE
jgi:AbrB family looped-hinge helix DNA binding protein